MAEAWPRGAKPRHFPAMVKQGLTIRATGNLRQDREGPRRVAEALLHLRPGHDDERALRRHLVEIGHDLDLVLALLKDVRLRLHLVGRVGVELYMSGRSDAALLVEKLDRLERPGRERRALESLRVLVPVLGHVGAQRDERTLRDAAVLLLPRLEVGARDRVVRVHGEI